MKYKGLGVEQGREGKEMNVWRNLKEGREEARDEDMKAFIFIERPNNAHAIKVIMRYNLYATWRELLLNFSVLVLVVSNISRACYIRFRPAT
jgi:hypothetical protein